MVYFDVVPNPNPDSNILAIQTNNGAMALDTGSAHTWYGCCRDPDTTPNCDRKCKVSLHDTCQEDANCIAMGYGSFQLDGYRMQSQSLCNNDSACVSVQVAYEAPWASIRDPGLKGTRDKRTTTQVQQGMHDGLVGLSMGSTKSWAGTTQVQAARFVYDGAQVSHQVCMGDDDDCPVRTDLLWRPRGEGPIQTVDNMILDTGSAKSACLTPLDHSGQCTAVNNAYGASCLVGMDNIKYLVHDYHRGRIMYELRSPSPCDRHGVTPP